ncbi:MAG: type II toxin-antitoxin system VapC family toxin [Nitrospirota bacterium]|nr:type II toxin-antitoxin system VapC family toxin [Nitrospirota bacterium]
MKRVIIDTDILIDIGRNVAKAVSFLDKIEKEFTPIISVVTQMELIVGCGNKKELTALDKFVGRFNIEGMDESIGGKAVELLHKYRLSHGLLIADALIAATAIIKGASLATKNRSDYSFIDELEMISYE